MVKTVFKAVLFILAVLFVSCQDSTPALSEPSAVYSVRNDKLIGQAFFVDENGTEIPIQAIENNQTVKCRHAYAVASLKSGSELKAVVAGLRDDGRPGVWKISAKNTVLLFYNAEKNYYSSLLPETVHYASGLAGKMGWKYMVNTISADGRIISGYAYNDEGYNSGRWDLPPGTTVGTYWVVSGLFSENAELSAARILGTSEILDSRIEKALTVPAYENALIWILNRFKLIFLSVLDRYIILPERISYSGSGELYTIYGKDNNDKASAAIVNYSRLLEIVDDAEVPPPPPPPPVPVNRAPYNINGPGPVLFVPLAGLEFNLLVDEQNGLKDPDGDTVVYNIKLIKAIGEDGKSRNLTLVKINLESDTGKVSVPYDKASTGGYLIADFWTRDPAGLTSSPYQITFYY
jgi:hypothetical protein